MRPEHPRSVPHARAASARYPLVLAVAALLSGLAAAADPIRVVATTGMVADTVRAVGGACVEIDVLMGPGIDPHLYRASAGDVDRLGRADLIVYNGLNLEGQLGGILERLGQRVPTLALAEAIAERLDDGRLVAGEDGYAGALDPHLWGAADLWAVGADLVADALGTLHPGCARELGERRGTHQARLAALHAWAIESVASVPEPHRTLVTAHDAFAYFGAAYGLAVAGIEGISTESEASIADIRDTAALVLETGVPAIFIETSISPRTIEAVQAAVRSGGGEVAIGGALFGDAMGDADTPEGSYIGMLRHNVLTIVTALGGQPAPWPEGLASWAEGWGLP